MERDRDPDDTRDSLSQVQDELAQHREEIRAFLDSGRHDDAAYTEEPHQLHRTGRALYERLGGLLQEQQTPDEAEPPRQTEQP